MSAAEVKEATEKLQELDLSIYFLFVFFQIY
jgi:hypothetical protein